MMPQIILERYGQNAHSDYKTDSPTENRAEVAKGEGGSVGSADANYYTENG